MTRRPPYRDGRLHVLTERCSTCVFRPGNLMSLEPGRLKDLIDSNLAAESALVCHKTLPYGDHPELGEALCRGFVDAVGDRSAAIQIAHRLGMVEAVPTPTT